MIRLPDEIGPLVRAFGQAGQNLYIVGGWVRNTLLGLPSLEIDACSALPPDAVISLLKDQEGVCTTVINRELGTVRIDFGKASLFVEHTALRAESYGDGGFHRPQRVRTGVSLEEDALRRDFTVNAIYYDVLQKKIIDPVGGLEDLEKKRIRTVCAKTLQDDALRILRMVRLACELDFRVEEAAFQAARENVRLLRDIAPERRAEELSRILLSDAKYYPPDKADGHACLRGLELLSALGAFFHLLPELERGRGFSHPNKYHAYDVLHHNFYTCRHMPPALHLRLAGLLHDVGKPASFIRDGNFYQHAQVGADLAKEMLGQGGLRYKNALVERVCRLIEEHMFDLDGSARENTVRLRFAGMGIPLASELLWLRRADILGSRAGNSAGFFIRKWGTILCALENDGTPLSMDALEITGEDIMQACGIGPGERVGRIKQKLWQQCVYDPSLNTREKLIRRAQSLHRELPPPGADNRKK
ncbi:MAG: CCA tRNA nucleotidyltransferase [Bacillota bacterium]